MAEKTCGNEFLIEVEDTPGSDTFTAIGTLRDSTLTINNEQVDTTDKATAPNRELKNCGINSLSLSGAGPFSDDAPLGIVHARARDGDLYVYRVTSGLGDQYQGEFQTASFERSGSYNNVEEYTMSLESSGIIAYTDIP